MKLEDQLCYDPLTGKITWKISPGRRRKTGDIAGWDNCQGYWSIQVDRKNYMAHRLAWRLYYGEWPEGEIDHIDRDGMNNRINNLRIATRSMNNRNTGRIKSTFSNIKGVQANNRSVSKPFQATIGINGKVVRLGTFASLLDAAKARYEAEIKYGYPLDASEAKEFIERRLL